MKNKELLVEFIEEPTIDPPTPKAKFAGDESATWTYWGPRDPEVIPDEWVWERLRIKRDNLLSSCDFRVVSDAPWDIQPWMQYRQELRDLTLTDEDPRKIIWPVPPQ